jgi:hypothetical protein
VVPYSGGSLTWIVKALKSSRSEATASEDSVLCPDVQPLADCRGYEAGVLKVKLGYNNPGAFEQSIPVGRLNGFSPGSSDRGQPNRFFSGLNAFVFEIPIADPRETVTWNINGKRVTIDSALKTCSGRCVDTPVGSIKTALDETAIELSAIVLRAAKALASLSDNRAVVSQSGKSGVDIQRAARKAAEFERAAKAITIDLPSVIKTCTEAPALCKTVDRQSAIDTLRGLYANQRATVKRIMARVSFRMTGKTTRRDQLVRRAKSLEGKGVAELAKIPRFATECK